MNLREHLNSHPKLAMPLLSAVTVCGLLWIYHSSQSNLPSSTPRTYFTADDGKTLFVDDAAKIPPFEHDGAEAVEAIVVTTDDGKHRWTQYLAKYAPDVKREIEDAVARNPVQGAMERTAHNLDLLCKRPGDAKWVPCTDFFSSKAVNMPSPGYGDGPVEIVEPDPSDH